MGIDKPGLAVQDRDGRVVAQNPLVLGVTQFLDTSLLLLEQLGPIHHRRLGAQACIEGTFRTQVGNMGRANHDLRRHTACIDTGTADGAAFDQGDPGAALGGFQGRRHGGAAAADHRDVRGVFITALGHRCACRGSGPTVGQSSLVAKSGHGKRQRRGRCLRINGYRCRPLRIGYLHRLHAGQLLQGFPDMIRTAVTGHATHVEFNHHVSPSLH